MGLSPTSLCASALNDLEGLFARYHCKQGSENESTFPAVPAVPERKVFHRERYLGDGAQQGGAGTGSWKDDLTRSIGLRSQSRSWVVSALDVEGLKHHMNLVIRRTKIVLVDCFLRNTLRPSLPSTAFRCRPGCCTGGICRAVCPARHGAAFGNLQQPGRQFEGLRQPSPRPARRRFTCCLHAFANLRAPTHFSSQLSRLSMNACISDIFFMLDARGGKSVPDNLEPSHAFQTGC